MSNSIPVLRVVRPTNDFAPLERFYMQGADFRRLAAFEGRDGFSGMVLGYPRAPWHLALVREEGQIAPRAGSPEQLLVLYLPDPDEWRVAVDRMTAHGYEPVPAQNPYWEVAGKTFEDPDGYRLVFQNRAWDL
ncbi:VOC family protein [Stappia taiwanensis]|uniref:VOC family protein n=1 Tax=Stappia taiwanensis TaxID=992267 RepID=A0A838XTE8_9HYPH|nr:VOC family protein [Stappia taiwanensis]MBA4610283.1 VOC family protein [Stappia taiwanensis]